MSIPGADEDLAEIHAAFAEEVIYTGAGLTAGAVAAIPRDVDASGFMGSAGSVRTKSFEIQQAEFTDAPAAWDELVTADGTIWRVTEAQRRDDVGAWILVVEHAE